MKRLPVSVLAALAPSAVAMGDIILSGVPQVVLEKYRTTPADASLIVGDTSTNPDIQWAAGFTTGSQPAALDSALFLYNGAWPGTSGGFHYNLHEDASGLPGAVATTLLGPDRPVNGITWYSASNYVLQQNAAYWLVASAPQAGAPPLFFEWRATQSDTSEVSNLTGWMLRDYGAVRLNGGAWTMNQDIPHTAIRVIAAVPEPSIVSLLSLGFAAILCSWRRLHVRFKEKDGGADPGNSFH